VFVHISEKDQLGMTSPGKLWHTLTIDETADALKTTLENGLSTGEASQRFTQFGSNELVEQGNRSPWKILLEQLTATMVLILMAAAGISAFLGEFKDALAILAIVVLYAVIGFSQEYRAEKAIAALKRMSVPIVRAKRDGKIIEVSARDLVAGDLVLIETGNIIPADVRLVEAVNLRIQEAALTGESEPVEKQTGALALPELSPGDQRNMAFLGTLVTGGRGMGLVAYTGMQTELGKIAGLLRSSTTEMTPLQRRLDTLGKRLGVIAMIVALIIIFLGALRGEEWRMLLLTGVSVAVAVVPEGLPAVVTITLALGAQRMLKRRSLIRKLPAVETLGSVTVICSDKTGTLTENRMTVTILDVAGHRVDLSEEYRQRMPVLANLNDPIPGLAEHNSLSILLAGGTLCNDAQLVHDQEKNTYHSLGDPTEAALVVAAAKANIWKNDLDRLLPRVAELGFDSERKRMTTLHDRANLDDTGAVFGAGFLSETAAHPLVAFTKGSVDGLLEHSTSVWTDDHTETLTESWQQRILAANDQLAGKGMRVLGIAFRALVRSEVLDPATIEEQLTFVGLVGLIDPPRPEVREAVATSKAAGIRPIMITGDHPLTASYIAKELGIAVNDLVLTGQDLQRMSNDELSAKIPEVSVFARVSPEHKLRIVQLLQDQGEIVAMTGDGVNDAPALKKADIGVAMGITGTDVSKEAADMVLTDDNFATIVAAVEEGRTIYDNLRKFIKFSLAGNLGKVLVVMLGPLLGPSVPLLPLQLLFLNLLTDGLLGLGLGLEKSEKGVMQRPPYSPKQNVLPRDLLLQLLWIGGVIGSVALVVGAAYLTAGRQEWQTMIFVTLTLSQILQAFASRSSQESIFATGWLGNRALAASATVVLVLLVLGVYMPFFQNLLKTQALGWIDILVSVAASGLVFAIIELEKWLVRRRQVKDKP